MKNKINILNKQVKDLTVEEFLGLKSEFELLGNPYKEGIARVSGNGACVTLPKKWVGCEVITFKK